jgi:HEPN domain-containing protein
MYEIAKMDLKSANILAKNEMYPQSIYFYEQSFEKALKSVVSEYLRHRRNMTDSQIENELRPKGHNVIEKTMQMMTLMIEEEVQLYIKRGGNESDPFIHPILIRLINISNL